MKYCSNCGNPLPDDAAFCGMCGTPAPVQQPAAPAARPVFCRSCGAQMPADAAVCPNCGTPVAATPPAAPAPRARAAKAAPVRPSAKKSPLPIILGVVGAVVLVAAVVVAALLIFRRGGTPADEFVSYQKALITDKLGVADAKKDSLKTDITLTAQVNNADINSYLAGSSVVLRVDAEKDKGVVNCGINLMGSPVLNSTLTYQDGKLGIYMPELDANYYVADVGQLLAGSLSSEAGVDLSSVQMPDLSDARLKGILEPYISLLKGVINENVTKQENVPVSLTGLTRQATCTVYTVSPTPEAVQKLLTDLANQMEGDAELRSLVTEVLTAVQAIDPSVFRSTGYLTPDGAATAMIGSVVNQLRQIATQAPAEMQQISMSWTLAVEGNNVRQIKFEAFHSGYNSRIGAAYEMVNTDTSMNEIIYAYEDTDVEVLFQNDCMIGADGMRNGTIYFDDRDTSMTYSGVQPDKRSVLGIPYGQYSLPSSDLTMVLQVQDGVSGGTDHILTVTGDSYYFDDMCTRVAITLNTTDGTTAAWPDAAPTDITNYTADQLYGIVQSVGTKFQTNVMNNFSSLMNNGW